MTIKKINLMLMCLAIVPVYFLCVFTVEATKKIQDNNKQQAIYYAELEEKYPLGTMVIIKLTGQKCQVIGYAYRKLDVKYYHSGTSWTEYYNNMVMALDNGKKLYHRNLPIGSTGENTGCSYGHNEY